MITGRLARPFAYNEGWFHEEIQKIGVTVAAALLRRTTIDW